MRDVNDGRQFLWSTERGGAWQVELRRASGARVEFITPKDLGYRRFLSLDEANGRIFVQGGADARLRCRAR